MLYLFLQQNNSATTEEAPAQSEAQEQAQDQEQTPQEEVPQEQKTPEDTPAEESGINPYPAELKCLMSIKPDFNQLNDIGWDFASRNY